MPKRSPQIILTFLFLLLLNNGSLQAQVLFTVGDEPVTEAAFKRAFLKNNPADTNNRSAMQAYLQSYIHYRLKVQAAYAARIDTLPMQKAEAAQFRNMIAAPYLADQSKVEALVKEAKERAGRELLVSQAFVPKKNKQGKLVTIIDKKKFTDSAFATNPATVGWVTVFSLPYKLESILYKLKDGSTTAPIATEAGWYIFKRHQSRPASGHITVAHLLVAFPPEPSQTDRSQALQKAESMYQQLTKGASFLELAKTSDDISTRNNGGILPAFSIGERDLNFEAAAFALEKDEDFSKPVSTSYGYHIIKRLKKVSYPAIKAAPDYDHLIRSKVMEDTRIQGAKDALIQQVLKMLGSRLLVSSTALFPFTNENLFSETPVAAHGLSLESAILTTGNTATSAGEWLRYANMMQLKAVQDGKDLIPYATLFETFRGEIALQVYKDHLEDFQPEFAALYKEFKEGNMLFELMQQEVWNKAAQDTVGLKRVYESNIEKYGNDYHAAIGPIINDYQQELEMIWLEKLKLAFPVKMVKEL